MILARRQLALSLIPVLGAAVALPSAASATSTVKTSIVAKLASGTPSKKKPKSIKVDFGMTWQYSDKESRSTLQHMEMLFPRGTVYNGAHHRKCSIETLNTKGPSACPKGSKVGQGRALADADTVPTRAEITVFNGGPKQMLFYTTMTNPAVVQTPVVGDITKLKSGPWGYRLTADIPGKLQVVAGVPIFMTDLKIKVGSGNLLAATKTPTAFELSTTMSSPRG